VCSVYDILHALESVDNRTNGRVDKTFTLLITDFRRIPISETSGWFILIEFKPV